ncbi:DUF5682 family protein [Bacillus pseudomycoides]|uniref:4-aminobutyrate aminotransferase n=2 Tax=Bacillus cereus group TaxID=86661 RepID=A0A2B5HW90_9BACI|nr:DUF5682 family protein [Bacillus pseudomycoides]PDY46394.1 hypothetical protein CON79_15005 [Bacillus pseudomycoides]PED69675.1 hypothetical protein CON97_23920 [Bacillus pseudomycoides]PEI44004.1 hypothetical protein CN620_06505 [Bacillus pseudomycoides]PEJ78343.1 hypothetical protein CN680_13285 [Bacillus pseudomycoides]PEM16506.1 hypothetical protein CN628_13530 [Bacillus pseudomycoides]
MEVVFRSSQSAEVNTLFQRAYNLSNNVVYVPIRHHSPACSFHVQKIVELYKPDAILIEGPIDCNPLIPHIVSAESEAPICIYCSYDDKADVLEKGESGKYRAYYPFLDYSPELVALREGAARNIPVSFIDLPYKEYLYVTKNEEEREKHGEQYFRHSQYVRMLSERTGCRSFHEFWEKYFELQGFHMTSEEFIQQLFDYCYYTRADYTQEMLIEDGCMAREIHMAKEIEKARKVYDKVLVITGGFHVKGLLELEGEKKKLSKSPLSAAYAKTYLMPYSFLESDQTRGYESGMPAPAFYQHIWENRDEAAAEQFMIRVARQLKTEGISIADEIEAARMIRELALLRGKMRPGLYELMDAVRSAFVKGEISSADKPLMLLQKSLQGTKRGKLSKEADVPPLVHDFRTSVRSFRLPARSTVPQETILDIYKKERHLRLSQFLHCLASLGVPFCEKLRGPNLARKQNINLMRETWKYRFSAQVESALIDLSVYGGTVREAAQEMLRAKLYKAKWRAGEVSLLLLDAYLSGLFSEFAMYNQFIDEAVQKDGDFASMADCAYYLSQIEKADQQADSARHKALSLFSVLDGGEPAIIAEKLIDLYTLQPVDQQFIEALELYLQKEKRESQVEGAVFGLLTSLGKREIDDVMQVAEGYFYGSGDMQKQAPIFLNGLFAGAKDIFLYNESLLGGMSHVLEELDEEMFLQVLPHLRLLFSQFTPLEVDTIARQIARLYGATEEVIKEEAISEEVLTYAIQLDQKARGILMRRGLEDGE